MGRVRKFCCLVFVKIIWWGMGILFVIKRLEIIVYGVYIVRWVM